MKETTNELLKTCKRVSYSELSDIHRHNSTVMLEFTALKKDYFYRVSEYLLALPANVLGSSEKLVLSVIMTMYNSTGQVTYSNQTLGSRVGLSASQISKIISNLISRELIAAYYQCSKDGYNVECRFIVPIYESIYNLYMEYIDTFIFLKK